MINLGSLGLGGGMPTSAVNIQGRSNSSLYEGTGFNDFWWHGF